MWVCVCVCACVHVWRSPFIFFFIGPFSTFWRSTITQKPCLLSIFLPGTRKVGNNLLSFRFHTKYLPPLFAISFLLLFFDSPEKVHLLLLPAVISLFSKFFFITLPFFFYWTFLAIPIDWCWEFLCFYSEMERSSRPFVLFPMDAAFNSLVVHIQPKTISKGQVVCDINLKDGGWRVKWHEKNSRVSRRCSERRCK